MKIQEFFFTIFTCFLLIFTLVNSMVNADDTTINIGDGHTINPKLLATYEYKSTANVVISMRARPTPILAQVTAQTYKNRAARNTDLHIALESYAQETQASVLEVISQLEEPELVVKSYWISNQIYVRNAPLRLVEALKNNSAILSIDEDIIIPPREPIILEESERNGRTPSEAEWGIVMVQAPRVWESSQFGGANGSGITVGIIDTGVRASHEAIRGGYRNDGFSWYDPYDETPLPFDDDGHGTHVTGTILGNNGIGVAPGAQWIGCRGVPRVDATGEGAVACGQFMLCPTHPDGSNRDCSRAPHVVSNSWGIDGGDETSNFFDDVIAAWQVAGIIPVFAIGNEGASGCSTANYPGDLPDVIGVGATTTSDSLAAFSSLGPSVHVPGKRTPDISAPGHRIRSALNQSDTAYGVGSGTSMACPHVAGIVALLLSHKPNLKFTEVKTILETSAEHDLTYNHELKWCGRLSNEFFPNNHFGYGRVNVYKAFLKASSTTVVATNHLYPITVLMSQLCLLVICKSISL